MISQNKHKKTQDNDILEDNDNKEDIMRKTDNTACDNSPGDILPPRKKMTFGTINDPPPNKEED